MRNLLSKELSEVIASDEHSGEMMSSDENSTFYREKLIELSERTASGFSVSGNLPVLILKFGKWNWLFGSLFIMFLGFFVAVATINIEEPIYLLLPLVILSISIVYAKFWSITNKITLDCSNKNLIIESDHWLGRHLGGKKFIPFSEIISFDKKLKRYRAKGQIIHYRYRIILKTNLKKHNLFEIPHGPIYYINENSMIESIKGIIKNAA
ncbi:hypothetical protein ERX46_13575 [Brumimicrobium glaciale]|jgi:hypothetical protein|uniref:DUF304 domain-containing protein n=1 Tax=Brumimicrobium glaciale TaxID=200475 RepID=A0A4Q4KGM8_9FLAO|nr:hypothetical protein [Brumimicrobium glaciale]RYM32311.1 hypothetical protein ERX46_13575 [Brumimicrobium glaciale]